MGWETHITRSRDLVHWQDAPKDRPFLTFDPERVTDPEHCPGVRERNASDVELVFWRGKTFLYFNGGDQETCLDLQWAEYAGPPRDLFAQFFR